MYPLVCKGGYPMPLRAGKFDIVQISAPAGTVGTVSRLTLIDDLGLAEDATLGRVLTNDNIYKTTIVDLKSTTAEGGLNQVFQEPLKVRKGISVKNADNLQPGSIMVYVR